MVRHGKRTGFLIALAAVLMLLAPAAALADGTVEAESAAVTCADAGGTRTVFAPVALMSESDCVCCGYQV